LGCDRNVISALTEVLSLHSTLVYLEDDVVPNPCFYDRMCRLLEAYRNCEQVCSVSAYANFPQELEPLIEEDFLVSKRVFALGFGIWADRWHKLNLAGQPHGYNTFKNFYNIPATIQTKYTLVNQFFLEKNRHADWVITLTLNALSENLIHIIPKVSFVRNIGCGHPDAKTYRGSEPTWINARYEPSARPNCLPSSLELSDILATPLDGVTLARHLESFSGLWLSLPAIRYFLWMYPGLQNRAAFLKLFLSRLPILLRRWRRELPI